MDTKKATDTITIPVAEYIYLQRVDALMDALLNDNEYYSNSRAVRAVVDTVRKMRGLTGNEAVEV